MPAAESASCNAVLQQGRTGPDRPVRATARPVGKSPTTRWSSETCAIANGPMLMAWRVPARHDRQGISLVDVRSRRSCRSPVWAHALAGRFLLATSRFDQCEVQCQPKLRNMPDSVETALQYWLKSKARHPDLADRLVFLRTALEALFLDRSNRAELAFRLATNGAWCTGRKPAERRQRCNTLKEVYAAASGAAHSGRVKNTAKKLLSDGREICRLAILKRLRSRHDPVWEDIVFGR